VTLVAFVFNLPSLPIQDWAECHPSGYRINLLRAGKRTVLVQTGTAFRELKPGGIDEKIAAGIWPGDAGLDQLHYRRRRGDYHVFNCVNGRVRLNIQCWLLFRPRRRTAG